MVVLTGSVRRHSRHDFRRYVFHAVEDNLRRGVQGSFNGRIWCNWLGELLNPRNAWSDKRAYDAQARLLAAKFEENFAKFDAPENVRAAGPRVRK